MKDIKITIKVEGLDGVEIIKTNKDDKTFSRYARYFDETNMNYEVRSYYDNKTNTSIMCEPIDEFNELFIRSVEAMANNKLNNNGYVMLNDVYSLLGMPESIVYKSIGWMLDNPEGDGKVILNYAKRDEHNYIIDFNVDGEITSKLEEKGLLK